MLALQESWRTLNLVICACFLEAHKNSDGPYCRKEFLEGDNGTYVDRMFS